MSSLIGLVGCALERPALFGGTRAPPAYDAAARESLRLPSGEACLKRLDALGVAYRRLGPRAGVDTLVEIRGPIAGVSYTVHGRPRLVCDCRLALALHDVGPVLAARNVSEVKHSGAYVPRTTRTGRPSLHARGLAIDAHVFALGQARVSVANDFERGLGCGAGAPVLNQLACDLRETRLFRELITPDHDAHHHDHFHLGIAPL